MKKIAIFGAGLLAVASLAGCAQQAESAGCVTVVIDYGILSEEKVSNCIEVPAEGLVAKEILLSADITTEGTLTYGDQIVCRVNNLPAADTAFEVEGQEPHTETCADMPPAFAYWALWIKDSDSADWAYAEEGIGTLRLMPGQSIGLAFSTNGETPTPN